MAIGDICTAGRHASALSVDAARLRAVAAIARVTGAERLALEDAAGRVLADAPRARTSLPPFDNSAMDGYAVRLGDFHGTGPFRFRVSERIIAGDTRSLRLAEGTAARIFTGAPIPDGADAVIMQESVTRRGSVIEVATQPRAGLNIRREGEDRRIDEPVLPRGLRLTPPRLALLAAAGLADGGQLRPRPGHWSRFAESRLRVNLTIRVENSKISICNCRFSAHCRHPSRFSEGLYRARSGHGFRCISLASIARLGKLG